MSLAVPPAYNHFETNSGPSFTSNATTSFVTDSNTSFVNEPNISFASNHDTSYDISPNSSFAPESGLNISRLDDSCKPLLSSFSSASRLDGIPATDVSPTYNSPYTSRTVSAWQRDCRFLRTLPATPEPGLEDHAHSFSSPDVVCQGPSQSMFEGRIPMSGIEFCNSRTSRPKKRRATQACTTCRRKKAGCDEARPRCSQCIANNLECGYEEPRPNKKLDAAHWTEANQEVIKGLDDYLDNFIIPLIEENKEFRAENARLRAKLAEQDSKHASLPSTSNQHNATEIEHASSSEGSGNPNVARSERDAPHASRSTDHDNLSSHSLSTFNLSPQAFGEGATLSNQLAQIWTFFPPSPRAIKGLQLTLDGDVRSETLPQLAKHAINKLGLMQDTPDPFQSSFSVDEVQPFASSSNNGATPNRRGSRLNEASSEKLIDSTTAQDLWYTYLEKIHKIFDFLDVDHVNKIIEKINDQQESSCTSATPIRGQNHKQGLKRKSGDRSPTLKSDRPHGSPATQSPTLESHLDSAIILLVFALAELYQYETHGHSMSSSSHSLNGSNHSSPHIVHSDMDDPFLPTLPPVSFSTLKKAGLQVQDYLCNQGHLRHNESISRSRNEPVQGIPGLNYYCCAMGLLGEFCQVSELAFAHAKMLAAIYLIKLCRPKEAAYHVRDAMATLELIQDPNATIIPGGLKDPRSQSHQICFSLEHEIKAELERASPMSVGRVIPPRGLFDKLNLSSATEPNIVTLLRRLVKHTNNFQKKSRHQSISNKDGEEHYKHKSLDSTLQSRDLGREVLNWKQAIDETEAMMPSYHPEARAVMTEQYLSQRKAAFRVLQSAIHRRFLHSFLMCSDMLSTSQTKYPIGDKPIDAGKFTIPTASDSETTSSVQEIRDAVKHCVDSLKQSTSALDEVHAMPSTEVAQCYVVIGAQAQFANILLLTEILMITDSNHFISRNDFAQILTTTIEFFVALAPTSSIIETELLILFDIQKTF